jgi:nitrate reductase NapAB chaperone NapD
MRRVTLLFWILSLCACSTGIASPSAVPASPPSSNSDGEITAVPLTPTDCGYQWSNQDLPRLASSFQQSIQDLQPEAEANAYAYGESCIRTDGSVVSFTATETDFNVTLHVDDLANQSVLGRWIVQVMQVIEAIPAAQIEGPRPGRVTIVFQSNVSQNILSFDISQYKNLPGGLNHEEVYQALEALQ